MSEPLVINETLTIPETDLSWTAVRSPGPGGQHVNKASTTVELRFALAQCEVLEPDVKARLKKLAGSKFVGDTDILIVSHDSREQSRNLDNARERLRELIAQALVKPKPRRATRVPKAAKEKRLESKHKTSETKRARRAKPDVD